jgi:hypothetical protein
MVCVVYGAWCMSIVLHLRSYQCIVYAHIVCTAIRWKRQLWPGNKLRNKLLLLYLHPYISA